MRMANFSTRRSMWFATSASSRPSVAGDVAVGRRFGRRVSGCQRSGELHEHLALGGRQVERGTGRPSCLSLLRDLLAVEHERCLADADVVARPQPPFRADTLSVHRCAVSGAEIPDVPERSEPFEDGMPSGRLVVDEHHVVAHGPPDRHAARLRTAPSACRRAIRTSANVVGVAPGSGDCSKTS